MGFWNRVWNTTVSAARWVGNNIVKPVVNTVRKVVNWVDRRVDDLYTGAKKIVRGTHEILDGFARMVGITDDSRVYDITPYDNQAQFLNNQNYSEADRYLQSIKDQMIKNHLAHMEELADTQAEELREIQERHEKRMQEIARAQKQRENLLEVVGIAKRLQSHGKTIESEIRFQQFDQFARLRISMTFLESLMEKLDTLDSVENLSKDELILLNSIDKFVFDQMKDSEYKQFDELILKFFGEDLLQIGSREILKDYRSDHEEKIKAWREKSSLLTKLRIEIKSLENKVKRLKDQDKIEKLRKDLEEKRKKFSHTEVEEKELFDIKNIAEEYLFSLETILNIASQNIQLNNRETNMVKEVAEIYLRYKNKGVSNFSFTQEEQQAIKDLNDLAMLNNWITADHEISGESEAEV